MINYIRALKILQNSKIKIQNEIVLSKDSINRIVAKSIFSPSNYPAGNNTAFDGYAISSKDTAGLSKQNKKKFKILKTLAAGDNPNLKKIKNERTKKHYVKY